MAGEDRRTTVMESNRLPIEIIDEADQPIGYLPVYPREVVIMQAAVLSHEDGLAEQYGGDAVELAERELRVVFAGATDLSWRATTKEALETDPQQAAKHYVLGLGSGALRSSRPVLNEARVETTAADGAVAVNMQELLDDDEDDDATGPVAHPLQTAEVDSRSLQVHAAMTEHSRETLRQAMDEGRTALHVGSAMITVSALASRIAELRDDRALQDEVDEVRRSISGILPVVSPEPHEPARRLLVPGLAAVAALTSMTRFGR